MGGKKDLDKMNDGELWQLFPVIVCRYDPRWKERYRKEKAVLEQAAGSGNIVRITHIGSTSVPGLAAKPTIDILLEITEDADTEKLREALCRAGYLFAAQPGKPAPQMMFMKGYTPEGFRGQAFHIHVRYAGDWDEFYFRDYLEAHPETAETYAILKRSLQKRFEYDRDGYTEAKTAFIGDIVQKARREAAGQGIRYSPRNDIL